MNIRLQSFCLTKRQGVWRGCGCIPSSIFVWDASTINSFISIKRTARVRRPASRVRLVATPGTFSRWCHRCRSSVNDSWPGEASRYCHGTGCAPFPMIALLVLLQFVKINHGCSCKQHQMCQARQYDVRWHDNGDCQLRSDRFQCNNTQVYAKHKASRSSFILQTTCPRSCHAPISRA